MPTIVAKMKKIEKLSKIDFLKSLELSPRLTIELLVFNSKNQILLIKRQSTPFINFWHVPGGFLLKNETINRCIHRIAYDEIGINIIGNKTKFVGVFETPKGDPRGHIIHYVVKMKIRKDTNISDKYQFFSKLPKVIPYQKKFILESDIS